MRMHGTVLALALLLMPVAAAAQQKPGTPIPHTGPIQGLLQHRTELALTGDQVQKLEALQQKNAAREQELVGKITAVRGVPPGTPLRAHLATPAERQAMQQKVQSMPELAELRQLHQQQIQEARAVLTPDQNAKAWAFQGPRAGYGHRGMGPGMMRHGGRGRGGAGPRAGW